MKDSKEKEHRISDLKNMIDNVIDEDNSNYEDIEEDSELIDYLNESKNDYKDLEIDDEFIYHPDNDKNYAANLEENPIDEDFLIKTPNENDDSVVSENRELDNEGSEEITGEISDSFDNVMNAKIGTTPVLGVISTILGLIFIVISAITFNSRSEKIVDNVISGESTFIAVIFIIIGLLLLIYGIYKVIGLKNPLENISNSINSIDHEEKVKTEDVEKEDEKVIPKSNIPLDKESFKIGEFNFGELKKSFKRSKSNSKPKTTPIEENLDDIPPAREKPEERKGLTTEEIEEIEYEKVKLENESIDDIFAEVEGIEDIPLNSDNSKEGRKEK